MLLEALCNLVNRFQPLAYRAAIPLGEKGFHMPLTFLLAEGGDGLADPAGGELHRTIAASQMSKFS
jgi:hypothetical protein